MNCFVLHVLSFELVKSMLPAEFHKVLANIRKVEARAKRRRLLNKTEEEGSESEEDAPKPKTDRYSSFIMRTDLLRIAHVIRRKMFSHPKHL